MSKSLDDPEFFLPSHFLTDDVVLHNMDTFPKTGAGFPTEFPYEFDSNSSLSSPVESVVGSTETESSDEEDFLAGLTRRLAQSSLHQAQKQPEWVMSGSPQSTLSGIGSWSSNGSPTATSSQVPSPPTTPFGVQNDTWDLIYAAAGQVARLKMTSGGDGPAKFSNQGQGLLGPPRSLSPSQQLPCLKNPTPGLCSNQSFSQFHHMRQESQDQVPSKPQVKLGCHGWPAQNHQQAQNQQHQQQQIQNRGRNIAGYVNGRCGYGATLPQSPWSLLQLQQHQNQHPNRSNPTSIRPILPNGSNVKRESTGTGVFLPRRYTNPAPEPRKKPGCPTVLLPAKVVQALNLNFEDMNLHTQQRFNHGLAPDHEALVARRNALLTQQRRGLRQEGPLNYEVRLPQEWTY